MTEDRLKILAFVDTPLAVVWLNRDGTVNTVEIIEPNQSAKAQSEVIRLRALLQEKALADDRSDRERAWKQQVSDLQRANERLRGKLERAKRKT